ncbi:MAG: EVE domain-containing protein [Acidobacteriota bacterium]
MAFWLLKSDPEEYGWHDLVREGRTAWTGVRNFQARNHLRAMREGELCLFYHSGGERSVVGTAKVAREAYPDPTAEAGDWACVDLEPVSPLPRPVDLAAMRADPALGGMVLLRQSRLSVSPVTPSEVRRLFELGGAPPSV